MFKKLGIVALLSIVLAGCGGSGDSYSYSSSYSNDSKLESRSYDLMETDYQAKDATVLMDTVKYDEDVAKLNDTLKAHNGVLVNSSEDLDSYSGLRYSYIEVKVASEDLDAVVNDIKTIGVIRTLTINSQDRTSQVTNNDDQIRQLDARIEAVEKLIEKAENIDDLIQLEDKLAELNNEKSYYVQDSANVNDDIARSVLYIEVREQESISGTLAHKDSYFSRMGQSFSKMVTNTVKFVSEFVLDVIEHLPVWIILGLLVVLGIRNSRKNRKLYGKKGDSNEADTK